jgi:hypothetical protein
MLLKRIYDKPAGWERQANARRTDGKLADPAKPEGACLNPPPFKHIEVKHTGTNPEQNFSDRLVSAGLAEGFISLSKGKLTLHGKPEDLNYTVKRIPGYYCCHCAAALPDAGRLVAPGVTAGMQHIADAHQGKDSPDAGNPAGYCRINHYECVLDSTQHEKFRVKRTVASSPAPRRPGKGN